MIEDTLYTWCAGQTYGEVLAVLTAAGVKKGRNKLKVENAIALCEDGFGYDLAMIVASMADLVEDLDPVLSEELGTLQPIIKCGLPSTSAIAFYEAGFAADGRPIPRR